VICLIVALFSTHISPRPYILFANRRDIRLMELLDFRRKTPTNIIVKNLEDAAALDFFLDLNKVCWSEINREVIRCAEIDPRSRGKVTKTDIVSTGLIKPEGIACDWVNNKIYWTDSDTKRIEVAGLSGLDSDRTVLVWENLDLPRPIAVDPVSGFMFWSDWGDFPKIEKCGMNGDPNTREILVDSDLVWPNGLTLDYDEKRLYWVEAQLSYIASVDFDGRNRRTIFVGDKSDLPQPFAISVFSNVLYWTDWDTKSLNLYNQTDDSKARIKIKQKLEIDPMDIKVFDPGRQPKADSPCREYNGGCSHICLAAPNAARYSCRCPTGFKMLNSTTCDDRHNRILLLAARKHIVKVSLDTPDFTDIVLPLNTVLNSIAIDFDPISDKVFWTDLADDKKPSIRSANLDGSEETGVVMEDVNHPDGLAVDWIVGNLLWTDSGTDRIEIVRLDGSNRRVIISEDLDEPRSIVVDSINGWIFWSDWGKVARIERSWMDGRSREIVVQSELVWPNGIALDVPRKKLYWCDAQLDRIEVSNWDGSERKILIDKDIPHPFGFTVMGNELYWTDWQDRSIQVADKYTGKNRSTLVSHLDDLMGLKAVTTKPNMDENIHPCHTRHCSHLCLTTPVDGAICSCPNGYELTADNRTCIIPEAFLLFTRRDDIRRISMETPNTNILIPLKGVQEASALDFDKSSGMIYWTDVRAKTISRAHLNGSSQETIVEFGLEYPEGLSVDWLAGNLYWVDAGVGRLEMSKLDGSQRRVLLWRDIDNPKSIVVDETRGYLYWSTWGDDPLIQQSLLDGSNIVNLVQGGGKAASLALDRENNRLYWTDPDLKQIKYIDIETGTISVLLDAGLPFSLTLFSNKLYWTDWDLKTVSKLSLDEPRLSRTVVHTNIDYVMDLLAYHQKRSKLEEDSECSKSKCTGICLKKTSQENMKEISCLCPSHYKLSQDGSTCRPPHSFILFSQRNKISRLVMDPVYPDQVPDLVLPIKRAKSIQAMGYNQMDKNIYWIDQGKRGEQPSRQSIRRSLDTGETDRLDSFDKMSSGSGGLFPYDIVIDPYTQLLYWSCVQTNSINVTRLIGNDSIPLGPLYIGGGRNLPRHLAVNPKQQLLFVAMSGQLAGEARIDVINLRSGQHDQLINSSLADVTSLAVDIDANTLYWTDRSVKKLEMVNVKTLARTELITEGIVEPVGVAVQGNWVYWADRDQNSIVRVDKNTGTSRQTVVSRIARLSSLIAVNHIPPAEIMSHPCNNPEVHGCSHFCAIGAERQVVCTCPMDKALLEDKVTCGSPSCKKNEFTCTGAGPTGQGPMCIPLSWRCDGQPECGDRSDELNCPECGPSKFQCDVGQCIPNSKVCDGISNCEDHSDETNCCPKSEFQCAVTKTCIDRSKLCNGEADCGDSSDELPPECDQSAIISGHIAGAGGGNDSATAATSTYLIAIFAALISLFMLSILVYYCRRRNGSMIRIDEDRDAIRPLAGTCSRPSGEKVNELGGQQPTSTLAGTLSSERHIGGAGTVRNGGSGGLMSQHDAGSSNGLMYDRSHVTGASSTADTSSSGNYPVGGGRGPPPSPVTSLESRMSKLSQFRLKGPRSTKRSSNNGFNNGVPTGFTYASTMPGLRSGGAPPCTPCSTDINDESDSVAYSSLYPPMMISGHPGGRPHFPSRAGSVAPSRTGYESETYCIEEEMQQTTSYVMGGEELPSLQERGRYAPPPSTPLYLSDYRDPDISGPPSPTTERSFFLNPCLPGPPPSPVPSPTHRQNRSSEEECMSD